MSDVDELRRAIEHWVVVEREGWAPERAARVSERLQRELPAAQRLDAVVVWLDAHTAFTGPGRSVYVGWGMCRRRRRCAPTTSTA